MCCTNMAVDSLCRIRGDDGDAVTKSLPNLQYNKYFHISNICIPSICISFKSHVHRPGEYHRTLFLIQVPVEKGYTLGLS
jgi:hypothetical protein